MSDSVVDEGTVAECEAWRKERREGDLSAMLDTELLGMQRVDLRSLGRRRGRDLDKERKCTKGAGSDRYWNATAADSRQTYFVMGSTRDQHVGLGLSRL